VLVGPADVDRILRRTPPAEEEDEG
jgi:hypothetical protein